MTEPTTPPNQAIFREYVVVVRLCNCVSLTLHRREKSIRPERKVRSQGVSGGTSRRKSTVHSLWQTFGNALYFVRFLGLKFARGTDNKPRFNLSSTLSKLSSPACPPALCS